MRKFLFFIVILYLLAGCKSQKAVEPEIVEVIEPEFNIISIAVIQADLINTQFEAVIKINNPNVFAVNLSSLGYELYGNGKLWADGKGKDILHIPAQSSCQTEFRFSMNFINMNRPLLDDIIAKRQVNYRFAGNVEVEPVAPNAEPFNMNFEQSGLSGVKAKATDKLQTGTNQSSSAQFVDSW
jgi:LEA14-like dessication related protein